MTTTAGAGRPRGVCTVRGAAQGGRLVIVGVCDRGLPNDDDDDDDDDDDGAGTSRLSPGSDSRRGRTADDDLLPSAQPRRDDTTATPAVVAAALAVGRVVDDDRRCAGPLDTFTGRATFSVSAQGGRCALWSDVVDSARVDSADREAMDAVGDAA